MTVEACQAVCQGLGFVLAGVEYADECCKYCVVVLFMNDLIIHRLRQHNRQWRGPGTGWERLVRYGLCR
jgi:hypothetical protein